ncbi:uncharacterized protein TRAVEDRAFT_23341 [Trametes versicolor FP-101664 SS1]|uniref:uncharacterized protein n=1 Tax=Trametes versicolor (strain FP-101664) TaxID=717944 RepID=UPI0004621A07|nr:uncharacterized protein TRAVEDRAFT_23341 [Trametes versicolor FP-101664 SS1]EIW54146.1 hypothetical protein TRAVEDRAFT_23341 [Trametes versicolor FP-101664 SS1]
MSELEQNSNNKRKADTSVTSVAVKAPRYALRKDANAQRPKGSDPNAVKEPSAGKPSTPTDNGQQREASTVVVTGTEDRGLIDKSPPADANIPATTTDTTPNSAPTAPTTPRPAAKSLSLRTPPPTPAVHPPTGSSGSSQTEVSDREVARSGTLPASDGVRERADGVGPRTPPPTPSNRTRLPSPDWILSPSRQRYSQALITRLQNLLDLSDSENGRYTIGRLPHNLKWGQTYEQDDNLYCLDGKPLLLLLVGEIEQTFFKDRDGNLKKSVTVYIRPIRATDATNAASLLASLTTYRGPIENENKYLGSIGASRSQTRRGPNAAERMVKKFTHAYDASGGYGSKKKMAALDCDTLGYKDVVIMETNIARFRCDPATGKAVYGVRNWTTWRASFNLLSVCRLSQAPMTSREPCIPILAIKPYPAMLEARKRYTKATKGTALLPESQAHGMSLNKYELGHLAFCSSAPALLHIQPLHRRWRLPTVTAYRFPKWGSAHVYSIALQHFAIDEGFDVPLFDNVFTVITEVSSERVDVQGSVFDVFYVTKTSTGGPNEALLRTPQGPAWKGELIVLRRAKIHNGYVNLRRGDRAVAAKAVFGESQRRVNTINSDPGPTAVTGVVVSGEPCRRRYAPNRRPRSPDRCEGEGDVAGRAGYESMYLKAFNYSTANRGSDLAILCEDDEPVVINIYGAIHRTSLCGFRFGEDPPTVQVKLWSIADGKHTPFLLPKCNPNNPCIEASVMYPQPKDPREEETKVSITMLREEVTNAIIFRLPDKAMDVIVRKLSVVSLLALRCTNKRLYSSVTAELQRARDLLLAPYVDDTISMWGLLEEYNAVVGGMAALAFFLRDDDLLPATLDVYVSDNYAPGIDWVHGHLEELDLHCVEESEVWEELPAGVVKSCVYSTTSEHLIRFLWTEWMESVLLPAASSPTTALANFVGAHVFGCGYPEQTLRRHGYTRGRSELSAFDKAYTDYLKTTAAFTYDAFTDTEMADAEEEGRTTYRCAAVANSCPAQGRYFGDKGSILQLFDPLNIVEDLQAQHQVPYGVTAVWRFCNEDDSCDGSCATSDSILPQGVTAISTVLVGRFTFRAAFIGWRHKPQRFPRLLKVSDVNGGGWKSRRRHRQLYGRGL